MVKHPLVVQENRVALVPVKSGNAHSRLDCAFPDLTGPIGTLFFILFEHSMRSRCLLAHRCPLRSGACGVFWSQIEIAQMSTQSPRVNTVSIQQTKQTHMTGSQTGSSWIVHGYSMYWYMLCANMAPAQCVDSSGFKAWVKTERSDRIHTKQNSGILEQLSWERGANGTNTNTLSICKCQIYTGATATNFSKPAYTKNYINNWLLMYMACNE